MTEDAEGISAVDEILDAPGDFFYPFSNLRLRKVDPELRITGDLHDSIATTSEDPTLSCNGKAAAWVGACLWAIGQLETELVALRKERSSGQES
jgi:hypothetical protein